MKRSKFPLGSKTTKLKPLCKKKSKTDSKNYWLISRLMLAPKVTENVIHNQAQNFLRKNKILYKCYILNCI